MKYISTVVLFTFCLFFPSAALSDDSYATTIEEAVSYAERNNKLDSTVIYLDKFRVDFDTKVDLSAIEQAIQNVMLQSESQLTVAQIQESVGDLSRHVALTYVNGTNLDILSRQDSVGNNVETTVSDGLVTAVKRNPTSDGFTVIDIYGDDNNSPSIIEEILPVLISNILNFLEANQQGVVSVESAENKIDYMLENGRFDRISFEKIPPRLRLMSVGDEGVEVRFLYADNDQLYPSVVIETQPQPSGKIYVNVYCVRRVIESQEEASQIADDLQNVVGLSQVIDYRFGSGRRLLTSEFTQSSPVTALDVAAISFSHKEEAPANASNPIFSSASNDSSSKSVSSPLSTTWLILLCVLGFGLAATLLIYLKRRSG